MQNYLYKKYGISKPVTILSIVSFLNDIASEMVYPIIPIFLTTVVGAPVHVLGLIEGVAEGVSSFLKVFSGIWSDSINKRKPFVVLGYGLSAISRLIYALSHTWLYVFGGRVLDRVGKGLRTSSRDALIADNTEKPFLSRAFSFHRGMDTLGAVLGPLVAILLIYKFENNFTLIFLFSAIPTIIAVALLIIFIKEKKSQPKKLCDTEKETCERTQSYKFTLKGLNKNLAMFFLSTFVFTIGNSADSFLFLKASTMGFSLIEIALLYSLFSLSQVIFSIPAGVWADKMSKKNVFAVGLIIFIFVYFAFGINTDRSLIWLLIVIYGVYMALTDGISKAFVAQYAPSDKKATIFGVYHFLVGIATFLASYFGGLLWSFYGSEYTFIYGAICAFVAFVILMVFVKDERRGINLIDSNNDKKLILDKNKEKIMRLFGDYKRVTNDLVENNLKISDAASTRLFDELEKEGKIRQVGEEGRGVYYIKRVDFL